ncbi:hypothetical protein LAZ67_2003181 [Cordylochernes scorpioides]|uniref:Uncharacterized protein n=1 Tax=Cordylochernes scorpioides TaxID=51811 RepID=A0ABY6K2L4_9ARAC|nr:hypothetical protein LAZ67_2003181 [Cordylochernes scorpioides]
MRIRDTDELLLQIEKKVELAGIGQILDRPDGDMNLNFTSHFNLSKVFKTNALVMDRVTSYMPYLKFEELQFHNLQGLQLADPQYQYTAPIGILLGADIAFSLFKADIKYGHEGPKLQKGIFLLLLRIRSHPIAITADITKMYRQISLHPDDTPNQRIIWRDESGQGCETVENGRKLIRELNQLLQAGGFKLRQWSSNNPTELDTLRETDKSTFYGTDTRWIRLHELTTYEIRGFADASQRAYAAMVYIKMIHNSSIHDIYLLAAKTRVATLKTTTTPRMELCALLFLAQGTRLVCTAMSLNINKVTLWSDSNIVLSPGEYHWIKCSILSYGSTVHHG